MPPKPDALPNAPKSMTRPVNARLAKMFDDQMAEQAERYNNRKPDMSPEARWKRLAHGCPDLHAERVPDFTNKTWAGWFASCEALLGTGCFIVLSGGRGSGKTQLATELIRECSRAGLCPRYAGAMDIFLSLREAFGPDGPTERNAMNPYIKADLLVIDEIHVRGGSEWEDRMLQYVLNKRYESKKDTVVISNLTRKELFESLGRSIESRFEEIGFFVECVGINFRKPMK